MNRASLPFIAVCLLSSHLMAQNGYRNSYDGRNAGVLKHLDGSVCFPPPSYDSCIYDFNSYYLDLYRLGTLSTLSNGIAERDPPQPPSTNQAPEPPPPPPTPVKPVMHEYNWPKEGNTPAPFSIVTTSGAVYLATMVWVQDGDVHFNSVDGDVRQLPLSSVSRSLTQSANAKKGLNLPLPGTRVVEASATTPN